MNTLFDVAVASGQFKPLAKALAAAGLVDPFRTTLHFEVNQAT